MMVTFVIHFQVIIPRHLPIGGFSSRQNLGTFVFGQEGRALVPNQLFCAVIPAQSFVSFFPIHSRTFFVAMAFGQTFISFLDMQASHRG